MSVPVQSYQHARLKIFEQEPHALHGNHEVLVLIVSSTELEKAAQTALRASLDALGWSADAACWLNMSALNTPLSESRAFEILESLDPLLVIYTDLGAQQAFLPKRLDLSTVSPRATKRILGRLNLLFNDFFGDIANPETKRLAWQILQQAKRR